MERGFSTIRRLLTDWRGSLGNKTVQDLMIIATRKGKFEDRQICENLIEKVATKFIEGDGGDNSGLILFQRACSRTFR